MKLPDGPKAPKWLRYLQLILRPIEYIEACQERYGDCFAVFGSDGLPIVYAGHPEIIQKIMTADSSQIEDIGGKNRVLQLLLGENAVLMLKGDRHKRQRQLLTPPFHGERMRAYGKLICEITEQVTKQWTLGKPINIRSSVQDISLRVILRLVFGLDEGERFQELRQLLATLLDSFQSPLASSAFFFEWTQRDFGPWSPWRRFLQLKQQIDELIYAEIRERREHFQGDRSDILTLLMSARDETGEGMSDVELRDELMTLLFAGHETTASALAWALYWIDRCPDVREKLLWELSSSSHSDPSITARLPYLSAVCSETLRIYPIATMAFVRIARSPLHVMGYEFPVGTVLLPQIYMAHHRPETYPEPKQFKPERFLERQYSPYEYLPFGGGNRRCIGMAFAQFEMKLVLAEILSKYRLTLADSRPVRPVRRGLTIAPPGNMRMVATPQSEKIPAIL